MVIFKSACVYREAREVWLHALGNQRQGGKKRTHIVERASLSVIFLVLVIELECLYFLICNILFLYSLSSFTSAQNTVPVYFSTTSFPPRMARHTSQYTPPLLPSLPPSPPHPLLRGVNLKNRPSFTYQLNDDSVHCTSSSSSPPLPPLPRSHTRPPP